MLSSQMDKRRVEHIAFINFRRYTWSITPKIKKALDSSGGLLKAYCTPSLSLLTIAALTPGDIRVSYIDEDFEEIDFDGGYDIVGISAMTQQAPKAYQIASEFRKRNVYVVIGGIHASVLPDEALQHADTVMVGEAEETWPAFLEDFRNNRAKRVYTGSSLVDITKSPVPRYDLLRGKGYFRDASRFYNMVPLQATRGCPHDCEFCLVSKIYGKRIRKKKIEQIKKEVLSIKANTPNKVLLFADDNLFVDNKYAKELVMALKELRIRWWAQTDIAFGDDEELLSMAYDGGCLIVLIGFESIHPKNLAEMNRTKWKYKQLVKYWKNIERIQSHGIQVFGSFIFGLDNDSPDVFRAVVEFMEENHITGQLTIATPLPGSRLEERLKSENRLLPEYGQWERCTFFDVLFDPKLMSKKELEDGFIWAYQQVFSESSFSKRAEYLKYAYRRLHS